MNFKKVQILILFSFILFSCKNERKELLEAREKEIIIREEQLAKKESEYRLLLQMRDSLVSLKDSLPESDIVKMTWPDSLQSNWNSKMICRESDCNNYVVGDQRNETWQFFSDSTGMYAKVLNNNKVVRIFKAQYEGANIIMHYGADSTAAKKAQMNVVLDDVRKKVIKGTQTITGNNNCAAKFSVELTPSTHK